VDVDGSKTEYMVRFLDAEGYDYVLLDDDDAEKMPNLTRRRWSRRTWPRTGSSS
jgi:hypothetical protein